MDQQLPCNKHPVAAISNNIEIKSLGDPPIPRGRDCGRDAVPAGAGESQIPNDRRR